MQSLTAEDKKASFEKVYVSYLPKMQRFVRNYITDQEDTENIVQDVFTELWENWDLLYSHVNILAFLFVAVKYRCVDHLRRKSTLRRITGVFMEEYRLNVKMNLYSLESFDQVPTSHEDIERMIKAAIDSLPEKCREIFIKNKIDGKKQKDIARELNISVNTVESQMAIAYRKLRKELEKVLPVFFFLIF